MASVAANSSDSVFDEIRTILECNGSIDTKVKDRLILMALSEFHRQLDDVPSMCKRIEVLERKSVWMWIERHPKATMVMVASFVLLASSDLMGTILGWLGVAMK